jgi:hypothetical protein
MNMWVRADRDEAAAVGAAFPGELAPFAAWERRAQTILPAVFAMDSDLSQRDPGVNR